MALAALKGPRHLLLVEDDRIDVRAMQRVLAPAHDRYQMSCVTDGRQALDLLQKTALEGGNPPCLILLDLNLPRMGGLEFLARLRQDPQLCGLPVLVLSTSNNARERRECYRLGASAYLLKDLVSGEGGRLLKLLDAFTDLACLEDQHA